MFCPNCGTELPENTAVCPSCGAVIPPKNNVPYETDNTLSAIPAENTVVFTGFETLKKVFSSSLFLALCVVISAAAVFGIISETFDLYAILGTIACWIIYANAKSGTEPLKQSGYKFASVITRIMYIINWIAVGLTALAGVFFALIFSMTDNLNPQLIEEFRYSYPEEYGNIINAINNILNNFDAPYSINISSEEILAYFLNIMFIALPIICVLVVIGFIIYNLCFVRPLDKYTHSLSDSFVTGNVTVYNKSLATRFLVFGIINAVFSIGSITRLSSGNTAALGTLCSVAVFFICYALINSAKDEQ